MIEFIKGKLVNKLPHKVIIEQSGLGYEIFVPFSTIGKLPQKGEMAQVFCHLQWRENEGPQLFGFATDEERQFFRLLTKVNKVGPKLAINIMSSSTPEKLAQMILSEDQKALNSLKGVGPKLASRLIVELKEPISKLGICSADFDPSKATPISSTIPHEAEVKEALETLGYTSKEINKSLKQIAGEISEDASIEEIIEAVLRSFA